MHGPTLQVVGIAASISPYTDGWIVPSQIPALIQHHSGTLEQMLYRVTPAGTAAQLRAATQAITAHVPHGAVQSVGSYLDVKRNADIVAAVMVPFLLAFSVFALVASGLIIGNVVGGAVVSSYRDNGVMGGGGFTPAGVVAVLLLQILVPALAGCCSCRWLPRRRTSRQPASCNLRRASLTLGTRAGCPAQPYCPITVR